MQVCLLELSKRLPISVFSGDKMLEVKSKVAMLPNVLEEVVIQYREGFSKSVLLTTTNSASQMSLSNSPEKIPYSHSRLVSDVSLSSQTGTTDHIYGRPALPLNYAVRDFLAMSNSSYLWSHDDSTVQLSDIGGWLRFFKIRYI